MGNRLRPRVVVVVVVVVVLVVVVVVVAAIAEGWESSVSGVGVGDRGVGGSGSVGGSASTTGIEDGNGHTQNMFIW